jgi:hypothetical protein
MIEMFYVLRWQVHSCLGTVMLVRAAAQSADSFIEEARCNLISLWMRS